VARIEPGALPERLALGFEKRGVVVTAAGDPWQLGNPSGGAVRSASYFMPSMKRVTKRSVVCASMRAATSIQPSGDYRYASSRKKQA
jgi:hypothetical protein